MATGTTPLPGPLSRAVAAIIADAIQPGQQAHIARTADISPAQLSRILSGTKVFKLDELDRVCEATQLNIVNVIADADVAARERFSPAPEADQTPRRDDYDLVAHPHTTETGELMDE